MKKGWTTSEFWVAAVGAVIPLLNQAFGWNIPPETIASFAGLLASYVISRGVAKRRPSTELVVEDPTAPIAPR